MDKYTTLEEEINEITPDLSIVKTEYFEVEDNELHVENNHVYSNNVVESELVEIHTADSTTDRSRQITPTADTNNLNDSKCVMLTEINNTTRVTSTNNFNYYGNKIILGIRKATEIETKLPKEHEERCFQTQLILQNWGKYLDESETFCNECLILFPTVNSLDYHKMNCHSHLVAINEVNDSNEVTKFKETSIKKSNVKGLYVCKICLKNITYKYNLFRHYKIVHKVVNITEDMIVEQENETCSVCAAELPSQSALIEHMYDKHYEKQHTCRICSKKFNEKKQLEDHLYEHAKEKFAKKQERLKLSKGIVLSNVIQIGNKPVIHKKPMETIGKRGTNRPYECKKCDSKFTLKSTLKRHGRHFCKGKNKTYPCGYCTKSFSKKYYLIFHQNSHKILKNSVIPKKVPVYSRIFYKCGVCGHRHDQSVSCKLHLLNIHQNEDTENIITVKVNFNVDSLEEKITAVGYIFKCTKCNMHFSNYLKAKYHEVHEDLEPEKCTICNLTFPAEYIKYHYYQHGENPDKAIEVMEVLNGFVETNGRVVLSQCPQCGIFFTFKGLSMHFLKGSHAACDSRIYTCQICNIKLKSTLKSQHISHHKKKLEVAFIFYEIPDKELGEENTVDEPEVDTAALLEKYKEVTVSWNLLFVCASCEMTTDNYTQVVQHCQFHVLGKHGITSTQKCNICDLNLEENSFNRHHSLHISNNTIDRHSFSISKYNYSRITKNTWFTHLFKSLPINDHAAFVQSSIYRKIRNVIFDVVQDGDPEMTSFVCHKCKTVVAENCIYAHIQKSNEGQCRSVRQFRSKYCGLLFQTYLFRERHYKVHADHIAGRCRVVYFNKPSDRKDNQILQSIKGSSPDVKKNVLYQCRDCGLAMSPGALTAHLETDYDCTTRTNEYYPCVHCKLKFTRATLLSHIKRHDCPDYTGENLEIILFDKKNKGINKSKEDMVTPSASESDRPGEKDANSVTEKEYFLYRCKYCKRCLLDKCSHICELKRYKEVLACNLCNGLKFSKKSLEFHESLHDTISDYVIDNIKVVDFVPKRRRTSDDDESDTKSVTTKRKVTRTVVTEETELYVFFKCKKCGVAYTSAQKAKHHACNIKTIMTCDKCGLTIFKGIYKYHNMKHKANRNYNRNNFKIVPFDTDSSDGLYRTVHKTQIDTKLMFTYYECEKCSLLYKNKIQALRHYNNLCNKNIDTVKCKHCDYYFALNNSYQSHLSLHKLHPSMNRNTMNIIKLGEDSFKELERKALVESAPEPTTKRTTTKLLKCLKCGVCCHSVNKSKKHTKQLCGNKNIYIKCKSCNLLFLKGAYKHHKNTFGLTHKRPIYIYIHFKPKEDDVIKSEKSINTIKEADNLHTDERREEKERARDDKNVLFQCSKCKVCYYSRSRLPKHKHLSEKSKKIKCCGLIFTKNCYAKHKRQHKEPNFKPGNFTIETFSPESLKKENKPVFQIYKCALCNLHCPTQKCMVSHLNVPHKGSVIESKECDICKLEFTASTIDKHIALQCTEQRKPKYVVTIFNQANEQKCDKCSEVFLTKAALNMHMDLDHIDAEVDCLFCGSTFNMSILNSVHLKETEEGVMCCLCEVRVARTDIVSHAENHALVSD